MTQKRKLVKGEKGYFKAQKKRELLLTILYFGIVLAVFLAGILTVKSRMNAMTVVAVVGVLPATKKALFFFMVCKKKECEEKRYQKICSVQGNIPGFFELLITSQKRAYPLDAVHVSGHEIIALAHDEKIETKEFPAFMKEILNNNHFEGVTVKLFVKEQAYLERLEQLNKTAKEQPSERMEDMLRLMLLISV